MSFDCTTPRHDPTCPCDACQGDPLSPLRPSFPPLPCEDPVAEHVLDEHFVMYNAYPECSMPQSLCICDTKGE